MSTIADLSTVFPLSLMPCSNGMDIFSPSGRLVPILSHVT